MRKHLLKQVLLLSFVLVGLIVQAQNGTISGKVSDKTNGEILPGANVIIQASGKGTSTGIDGTYKLSVPAGTYKVSTSFIGYQSITKEVSVKAGQTTTIDFVLGTDMMQLDEMVVIGYGSKRKRSITSSISKVKAEEIDNLLAPSFEAALQGQAAGMMVTQDNGTAGGPVTIRVRGTSSINASSEPLYVVDGVPVISGNFTSSNGFPDRTNALAQINPNDIASIEVLKDASAAAIYGARGANGVVLITTKQGQSGKPKVSVNYKTGISDVTHKLEVLDGPTYLKMTKEAWYNSKLYSDNPEYSTIEDAEKAYYMQLPFGIYDASKTYEENKQIIDNTNVDWIDESLQTGTTTSVDASASGGTESFTYYVGANYDDIMGILKGDAMKRAGSRINLAYNGPGRLSFGSSFSISRTDRTRIPTGWAGGLGTAQSRSLPIMPIYNEDGTYFAAKTSGKANVVAERVNLDYNARATSLLGNLYANLKLFDGLNFRTDFGFNTYNQREYKYEGRILYDDASAFDRRVMVESYNFSNTLSYDKTFKEDHNITAMAGLSQEATTQYDVEFWGNVFPADELKNPNSAAKQGGSSYEGSYGFVSYFGRIGYAYKSKYIVSLNVRRDGSSRFGSGKKYGVFPAASLGWIISDEDFFKAVPYLTFLKLRASYGTVGNAAIGNYAYLGTFYTTKYNGEPGIGYQKVSNPNLGWEKTTTLDIGLEYGFFDGRVSGGVDYYYKYTSDMLLQKNVPETSGFPSAMQNLGIMENKGWEIFVRSYNINNKFKWNTDLNITNNKNNVIDIQGQIVSGLDVGGNYGNNFVQEGHPIGAWRLVEYAGVDPATGAPLFINQETGEATTEYNYDRDAVVTGNPYPEWYGGITNTFSYKGFDFSVLFTFALGHNVYRDDGKFLEAGKIGENWNQMSTILDRWQQPGDNASIPKLIWEGTYSTYNTTQFLDDASYGRLKNLTFGYTLPQNMTQKLNISKVRIYVSGTNVLTFTKFKGWDPEVNRDYGSNNNVTQSVTYLSPPQAKTFLAGVNLDF